MGKRKTAGEENARPVDEDQVLMKRISGGDNEAFRELVSRYQRPLMTFCYSFLRNHASAEDITQEAFLRVFRHASRYRPSAKFSTWLYRIAANLCINESKKRKLRSHLSLDTRLHAPGAGASEGSKLMNRIASSTEIPLTKVERKELAELLKKAIEALPSEQRKTLIMVEYLHMQYREVADILGVSLSAVKMRIKRARESLRIGLQLLGAKSEDMP